jgi:hypothetical protein
MKRKIFITENQFERIFKSNNFLFEDDKKIVEETKNFLRSNGWPSSVIGGSLSQNHVFAQSVLNAIRELNNVYIAQKVITGTKGKYDVCIAKPELGTCNVAAGGSLYVAKDFSDLAEQISNKKIGNQRASDIANNDTIYFQFGKLQKELDETFKYDKHSWRSSYFPEGWWNFFTKYFGTDNYSQIKNRIQKIASYDISYNKGTLNQYEKGTSVWDYISDCFSDYHCVMDVASIAVLAIPGVGLALSAGIDFANASTYGVEAFNAKTKEERDAAIIAGGLTLFGGFLGGGVGQTKRILTKGSANPKVFKYADEVIKRVDNELPLIKNVATDVKNKKLVKIYKETAEKYGLNQSEILLGHDIIDNFAKIDPKVAKIYSDALTKIESRVGKANLLTISKNKNFKNLVLQNNGDVITSLKAFMKTTAGKEALQELGAFIILSEVLSEPEVAKWLSEKINLVQHTLKPTVQTTIKNDGYDWKATKEIFLSDGSVKDNTLLFNAYNKGWRPWGKSEETPNEEDIKKSREWLINNPKFQTKNFKDWLSTQTSGLLDKSISGKELSTIEMAPENIKDRKENVRYVDNKEEMDALSGVDDGKSGMNAIELLNQQQEEYLKSQK